MTDDYQVEMYADPGPSPDYVGVAFSADDEMVIVISSHIIHSLVVCYNSALCMITSISICVFQPALYMVYDSSGAY